MRLRTSSHPQVLADPLLAPFFQGVPMEKQRAKQVGGRVRQQGWVMQTAGARMAGGGCALCVALSA